MPRSSTLRSRRTSAAPAISSLSISISPPAEFGVDLPGLLQILQLLQSRECAEGIGVGAHFDALEQLAQLSCAVAGSVAAAKPGQLGMDAVKVDPITAIVAAARADAQLAAREFLGHDRRELADAIVLGILADVEDLAAH